MDSKGKKKMVFPLICQCEDVIKTIRILGANENDAIRLEISKSVYYYNKSCMTIRIASDTTLVNNILDRAVGKLKEG